MWALYAVFGLLAVAAVAGSRGSLSLPGSGGSGVSSDLRRRALDIVAEVVPSAYPDQRFSRLGFKPTPGSNVTSCGALPGFMGVHLGDPTGITRWGVEGARQQGTAKGAWIISNGSRRPSPGDIYGVARSPGSILVHVGVFVRRYVNSQGQEVWVTADAGQGPTDAPAAAYVERIYDPRSNTLTRTDNREPRYVEGWIDLGAWPFPPSHVAHLVSPADDWRYPTVEACDGGECQS